MRKLLSFIVATALFGAGAWLLVQDIHWSKEIYPRAIAVSVSLMGVGGYWLWMDFIGPAFGINVEE